MAALEVADVESAFAADMQLLAGVEDDAAAVLARAYAASLSGAGGAATATEISARS